MATISGNQTSTYLFYPVDPNLTVASSGSIQVSSGDAIDGYSGASWMVTNYGVISSATAYGLYLGGTNNTVFNSGSITGYLAVNLITGGSVTNYAGATITSNGSAGYSLSAGVHIIGGAGSVSNAGDITATGYGVSLEAGGTVTNLATGSITGGEDGVFFFNVAGTLDNFGAIKSTIDDGVGFFAGGTMINEIGATVNATSTGGYGPAAVFFANTAGSLQNDGSMIGTVAGAWFSNGGSVVNGANSSAALLQGGTYGVYMNGGSANAAVSVTNGGTISGSYYSVDFATNNAANLLTVLPGAVFTGNVTGGTGVLELASGGAGSIGGVSSSGQFQNFSALTVDSGATWTLTGAGNAIATLNDNGSLVVAQSLNVTTAIAAASTGAIQIGAAGSSGTLEVAADTSTQSQLIFAAGGKLIVDNAASFGVNIGTASYAGPLIENFQSGDTIDLLNFSSAGATVSYDATTGLAQITNGSATATLAFQTSSYGGGTLQIASDGGTGVNITETPSITAPVLSGAVFGPTDWTLSGSAQANATITIYDGANVVGSGQADGTGAWTVVTSETNASVHVLTAVATAAGNSGPPSAPAYLGTPNDDVFSFASESALAAAALVNGDGGADTLLITTPAILTDADFAHVVGVEALALTGASSVTLGANANSAGLAAVSLGAGAETITDSNSGALNIDGAGLGAGNLVSLIGSTNLVVSGLTGNLDASAATGTLTATLTGAAPQTVKLGSVDSSITDNGAGATIDGSNMIGVDTLTLAGSGPVTVTSFRGSLAASGLSGALNATLTSPYIQGVTLGTGDATIADSAAGVFVNATNETAGRTVAVSGSGAATVWRLAGNLDASALSGALTAVLTGTSQQTVTLGSGNAKIIDSAAGGAIVDATHLAANATLNLQGSAPATVENMAAALLYAAPLTGSLTATLTGATKQIVSLGSGDATITDNAAGAKIYAGGSVAGRTLTLIGSAAEAVYNLAANLDASGLTGALTATLTGASQQTVTLGSGNAEITDNAAGATIDATDLPGVGKLTLAGSAPITVTNLAGTLAASGLSGALNATLTGATKQSVSLGSGDATITDNAAGASISAAGTAASSTVTLSGSAAELIYNLAANLDASTASGALTAALTGTSQQTVTLGSGNAKIIDNAAGGAIIDATHLAANATLSLQGSAPATVENMAAALLYAAPLTGSLTATLTGATKQAVSLGSGDATITDNAAGAKIYAGGSVAGRTLTLIGSAAEAVYNLAANLDASGLTGALDVTTRATSAISIATGSGSNTIHAEAMTANELLNLAGSQAATVYLGGDLSASGDTGALTIFATGTGPQTIQTGSGADSITAALGGDVIQAGLGADSINVAGHTAADSFVYSAVDDSANTAATHDAILGFVSGGAFNDILDFSALNPNLSIAGQLAGGTIAAGSIGWIYSGGDAEVFVNNTGGALSTTSASLLEVTLSGVGSGLTAAQFKA